MVANQPIVLTPGFWSHDEWDVYDALVAGSHLPAPVTPVGFAPLGLTAPFMTINPVIPHLFDVLMHGLIGLVLAYGLRRAGSPFWLAAISAILFGLSPLAAPSTGWVAAAPDRWATLFILLGAGLTLLATSAQRQGAAPMAMATVATLGILSKLTAVILPVAVMLAAAAKSLILRSPVAIRPHAALLAAAVAPVAVLVLIRLPVIGDMASGDSGAALEYVVPNALIAVAYPFVPPAVEPGSVVRYGAAIVTIAAALHALLVLTIVRLFGVGAGALYAAAYLVYLAPVIVLPTLGGQHFYGCAVALSIALAASLLRTLADRDRLRAAFVLTLIALTLAHQVVIQLSVYRTGACQTAFYRSLDGALATVRPEPGAPITVGFVRGAPDYIARRAVNRPKYEALRVSIVNSPVAPLVMQPDCSVAVQG